MDDLITRIRALAERDQYDEALRLLDRELPEELMSSESLILKGNLILLGSDTCVYALLDAKRLYERACALCPDRFEAFYELGMYHENVCDDPKAADECLRQAREIIQVKLGEVEKAIEECRSELEERQ